MTVWWTGALRAASLSRRAIGTCDVVFERSPECPSCTFTITASPLRRCPWPLVHPKSEEILCICNIRVCHSLQMWPFNGVFFEDMLTLDVNRTLPQIEGMVHCRRSRRIRLIRSSKAFENFCMIISLPPPLELKGLKSALNYLFNAISSWHP